MADPLTTIFVEGCPVRLYRQWFIEDRIDHAHAAHEVSISYYFAPNRLDLQAARSKLPSSKFTTLLATCKGIRTLNGHIINASGPSPCAPIVLHDDFHLLRWEAEMALVAVLNEFKEKRSAVFLFIRDTTSWLRKYLYSAQAQAISTKLNRTIPHQGVDHVHE